MAKKKSIILQQELLAKRQPFGDEVMLLPGTKMKVLGKVDDAYTIEVNGDVYKIDGHVLDGLLAKDKASVQKKTVTANVPKDLEEKVWEQLRTCYDPEIPVNIVDLGFIYGVDIKPLADATYAVDIRMTLTTPGCSMAFVIVDEIKYRLLSLAGISKVEVEFVFDPPWDQSMISMQAKLDLGIL
jgi:probable FeS assembly SUF system protein SufT